MIDVTFVERLPPWLRGQLFGVEYWQYLAILLILLFGLIVRKVIQYVVKSRVRHLVDNLGQAWAARLVDVFASPGATLIMAAVLRVSYRALRLPPAAEDALLVAVRLLVVVSVTLAAYRLVDVLSERLSAGAARSESKLDDQLIPLMRKSLKIFTFVAGVVFVLLNLDVNIGSLLAGLGIGGIAVALAAKDTLANFFGSIMIFADRPFQVGDWVAIAGAEGIVEEVGFRSTRIRTFYNSQMTVPNAKFTEANIDNYGRREYRRTNITLGLTYDTPPEKMQAFVEGIRAVLRANPYTRKDLYEVHMAGFGACSLDVLVYFFFKVDTWSEELRQRHNVFLEILRLAQALGVTFAFPTRTMLIDSLPAPGAPKPATERFQAAELAAVVDAFGPGGAQARPSGPVISDGHFAVAPEQGSA
ncbi:MAG TPA: mechanosensitive ion channel family protein [Polyangiaceae bacterium]|nr:mechanosensitive ion channel family protein [Polyangiaceae bacterium]